MFSYMVWCDMENSDAWKRLNVMATKWVKKVEGKGEMKLLGLDLDLGNIKEVDRIVDVGGNQDDLVIKGGESSGVENIKEGDEEIAEGKEESEDLPGFDQEQMNILKALLNGVERDSLVHVQGLSEPRRKTIESWADVVEKGEKSTHLGRNFTKVKDSVKVAKERGVVGKRKITGGVPDLLVRILFQEHTRSWMGKGV